MMNDSLQPLYKPSREVCQWAMFCHLSALIGLVFPFGNLLAPLIFWQMKRESDPFIDSQGKEALNFQITAAIAGLVCIMLMFVVIGVALFMLVCLGAFILTVIAGVKANNGLNYRYPFTLRFIK
ncbi:orotate phosphoribosyltransferase [Pseudomonas congelans]|nr:orotate phosphoribosyltransferase [Pseudomonas congelans]PBQ20728.1 orotate phosphoribosyltransferase [Pseudomonas congelans]